MFSSLLCPLTPLNLSPLICRRKGRILLAQLIFSALFTAFALAQSVISSGALTGTVSDQTGAGIAGATVKVRRVSSGFERTATTDAFGNYRIESLQPTEYLVSAVTNGFSVASQQVVLEASGRVVNFTLRPGSLTENVSVITTDIATTPEELQRIPGSVEVLDRQTLEIARPFTFNEALRKFTGVYVRDEEGFGLRPSISIRGLDPNRSAKVLLLEDGVPLGHAPYGDTDAYYHPPIERYNGIEILKGSGQIAHGPNTLGGLLNYLTPNPPTDGVHGAVTLTGGNRRYFNGFGSLGASFGEGAGRTGLLVDFLHKRGEGARENMFSKLHDVLFKTVTQLDRDAQQTLSFKANYYGENSQMTYSGLTEAEFAANPRFNPFKNDFFYGDRWGGSAMYTNAINSHAVFTTTVYATNFQRDWWRQSSNSDQRPNRRGNNGCNGLAELNTLCGNEGRLRNYNTVGIDPRLKVSSRAGETDFGFRYHRETQNRVQLNNTLGPNGRGGVASEHNQRKNSAVAGYVQHRFLFGKFAITPGLRLEHVNIERTDRLRTPNVIGKTNVTQLIPGIGVSFSPKDNVTFFAGAHRGFAPPRPADIISGTGGVLELDPELSWNYEVGVRSLPVKGLRLDAAFFRLDYENQIVPANLSGGVGSTLTSAGATLHQGFEFAGRVDTGTLANSPHNFYLRAALTFIPTAEYRGTTRFSNISGFATTSIIGNRLIYSPERLANLNFGYSHPTGIDALLEYVYVSQQFGDDLNTVAPTANGQRGLLPAYGVWNATLNYRLRGFERFVPTVFVTTKNLTDDTFIVDRRRGIMPGMPRLLQAGVKFSF